MPNYMQEWDGTYPRQSYIDVPTAKELPGLKALAYSGSGPAALSVMLFYINDNDNDVMQCYWASVAAQNGSPVGAYNLATCYESKSYPLYSRVRAKFWYQRSLALGEAGARKKVDALEDVEMNQNSTELSNKPNFWKLARYENAAYSGSGAAAILLAEYYSPDDKSCYWYAIAAENESSAAWPHISKCYADKSSWRYSPHREKFWLRNNH